MFVLEAIKQYAKTGLTALVNRGERVSYAELDARSEAFAAWLLRELGEPGEYSESPPPILIYGHKQSDFLPCIYGALKAGRAYVPVDTVMPPERAAEIARDLSPGAVVDLSGAGCWQGLDGARVLDAAETARILCEPVSAALSRAHWVRGGQTAYILFTSGSTGRPKGVPITADNLQNFHEGLGPWMRGGEGGVALHQISYSFDVSCCSTYEALSRGMVLFTVDKEMLADVGSLFRYLGESNMTLWVSTPSFAELCVRSRSFDAALLPGVEQFLFCGEVLTHKLCDSLAARFPDAEILNTYGPTEATVLVSAVRVSETMRRDSRPIPIGEPLDEVTLRLVDGEGRELEGEETQGELLILSDSVGPGYHNRPEQTAERFFEDVRTGKRGYRTGDICYRKDGLYYYCGRADNQLKLGGYRVEIEDIENNLAQFENIARAAVLPVFEEGEESRVQYLVAFLLLEREDGLRSLQRTVALKKRAAELLPPYMIPRKLIVVEEMPLNTNGKVDKQALAATLRKAGSA